MRVMTVEDLEVYGVYDRGIPNKECVVIHVKNAVNTGSYGLMVGVRGKSDDAFPINDNLFWFGEAELSPGDWVFVYTGAGEFRVSEMPNSKQKIYVVHWGRSKTVFHMKEIVPILFRIDAVHIVQEEVPALPKKR